MSKSSKAYYAVGGAPHPYHGMRVWNVYSYLDDHIVGEMVDFPHKNALVIICDSTCLDYQPVGGVGCTKSRFHLIIKKNWIDFVPPAVPR